MSRARRDRWVIVARRWSVSEASSPSEEIGDTGVCRFCERDILYREVNTPGFLPRTGWSDEFPRDPLVCFSALNYKHEPKGA